MRWLIWLSVILSINGCFYGGPTVQEMTDPCVRIPPPAPLAKAIDMRIVEGDLIRCDAGCETLLRQYDGTRQAIIKAWPP